MRTLKNALLQLYKLYLLIKEPRMRRIIYFVIYILLAIASGVSLLLTTPRSFENAVGGAFLISLCGWLIVIGSLVCAVSILPGIWMFERAGLVAIGAGMAMYTITLVLVFGATIFVAVVPTIFVLFFSLRWLDIWEFLLAPREG